MPQERNVFRTLTVAENLSVSAWGLRDVDLRRAEVIALLPTIRDYLNKRAGGLSGGQRQMVGLAMALMARPKLLLVDEPTAGLSPLLVGEMLDILGQLATGAELGILIVEQNARAALQRAKRAPNPRRRSRGQDRRGRQRWPRNPTSEFCSSARAA